MHQQQSEVENRLREIQSQVLEEEKKLEQLQAELQSKNAEIATASEKLVAVNSDLEAAQATLEAKTAKATRPTPEGKPTEVESFHQGNEHSFQRSFQSNVGEDVSPLRHRTTAFESSVSDRAYIKRAREFLQEQRSVLDQRQRGLSRAIDELSSSVLSKQTSEDILSRMEVSWFSSICSTQLH